MPKRKGKNLIRVNFEGVQTGGGGRLLPEGTYSFELEELEEEVGQDSGEPYLKGTFKVAEGEYEGTKAWDNFSLQPQALWKLRSFLESAGYATEDAEMELDPDELIGLVGTADIIHEDYKNKTKHRINSWLVENEEGAETTGKEEPAKGGPRKKPTNGSAEKKDEPEFSVGDAVSFKEGKKTLRGKISEMDDDDNITVKVGKEEYVMTAADISAA